MKHYSVAIDGPSSAGKSTIARAMAADMRFIYVDTGAMYRAVGLFVSRLGIDSTDAERVITCLPEIDIDISYIGEEQHIFLNGEDVNSLIRTESASIHASNVSAIPEVRAFLLDYQRSFAASNNVIMDGRDIGTVVLPDADVKIFLTASAEVRARRRYKEQKERGEKVTYREVLKAIRLRDKNDSTRASAPLRAADDAVVIDTSDCDLAGACELVRRTIREKIGL
ncbi:MAG: (d)CMP kinase [Clostridia bacterium]|nr:(d)CMP kinase [Clostridia bacterium]